MISHDKDVKEFFAANGFACGWDFNAKRGEYWNEFYLGGKLICQIDLNVPLNCLLEDLRCWKNGREPTSNHNYKFNIGSIGNEKILFDNLKL